MGIWGTDAGASNLETRLCGIIMLWNDMQHFYPYFDEVKVDWEKHLPSFLEQGIATKDKSDYKNVINIMTEKLQDGHIGTSNPTFSRSFRLPFAVDIAEGQLVITNAYDDSQFQPGDIITSFNGKDPIDILTELQSDVSGSPQVKEMVSLYAILHGEKDAPIKLDITRDNEPVTMTTSYDYSKGDLSIFPPISDDIKELEDGIYYVNLLTMGYDDLTPYFNELQEAKGIIFDIRGYPSKNIFPVIGHLIDEPVKSPIWKVAEIIYPDGEVTSYNTEGRWEIEPQTPQFKGEFVFLSNAAALSSPETFLGFIEDNKIGQIVGQPTAGANGNTIPIKLPGDVVVLFTGLKAVKGDGSQHHLIGVEPTIPVERTIKGIKEGRDEHVDAAIQFIKGNY